MKKYFIDFGAGVIASYPFSLIVFVVWPSSWIRALLLIFLFFIYIFLPFNRKRFKDSSGSPRIYIATFSIFTAGLLLGAAFLGLYALNHAGGLFLL